AGPRFGASAVRQVAAAAGCRRAGAGGPGQSPGPPRAPQTAHPHPPRPAAARGGGPRPAGRPGGRAGAGRPPCRPAPRRARGGRWQAEEILHRVAGTTAPQSEPGDDRAARTKYRDAWKAWWKDNGATTKLAAQPVPPPLLGFTVIAAIADTNPSNSRVLEVD